MCDIYFIRQIFILSTSLFSSISVGFMLSFPAILNPSILNPNSTDIRATTSEASWIASSNGLAGMVGFFFLSPVMQIYGRKAVFAGLNFLLLLGWITFAFTTNISGLFAGRIIQGLAIGGVYINAMIISEYAHPKRRGYFLTIKKAFITIGILICHSMVISVNWRYLSAFGAISSLTAVIMTFFWPESPSYLAMRGRFDDCKQSYSWLFGQTEYGNELKQLISTQTERLTRENEDGRHFVKKLMTAFLKRDFRKAFLIVALLTLILDLCGRYYFIAYVIQIMVEVTGDKSIAVYCSIGADCFQLFALVISCFIIRFFKRRILLFAFGGFSVLIMFLVSCIVYLKTINIGAHLVWLTPVVIVFQNFVINVGLVPLAFTLVGEVFPLEYKGIGSFASGLVFTAFYSLTLKITPIMMANTGVHGTYGIYGLCLTLCLVLLYFILPETKDKTLQEIENELKGGKGKKRISNGEEDTLI